MAKPAKRKKLESVQKSEPEFIYTEKDMNRAIEEAYQKGRSDAKFSLKKSESSEKTYTWDEYEKGIEETYALGFKHGREQSRPPMKMTSLYNQIQIENLSKSISDNGRKINDQILKYNNKVVNDHMREWKKDADKALDEILAAAELHEKHEGLNKSEGCCEGHGD